MTGIDRRAPRTAGEPKGTSAYPAMKTHDIADMPAPLESGLLEATIDYAWIQAGIDAGHAVVIVVDPTDIEVLRDLVQNRLGFNIVIRRTEDGLVWVCRPDRQATRDAPRGA